MIETYFTIAVLVVWLLIDAIINWLDQDPTENKDPTKKT